MARVTLDDGSEARQLRRIGHRWLGEHPACGRPDTLSVNPDEGVWFCFGCKRTGRVVSFQQIKAMQ